MEKEFIPYEQTLDLMKLGFSKFDLGSNISFAAPLYQQAFRWFRENYGLDTSFEDSICENDNAEEIQMWDFFIYKTRQKSDDKKMAFCSNNLYSYIESYSREEAELECIKKLIEIAKSK